jgi:phenylpropionate dioxygenase-like ring-hydroxylating dioxygenase large terminal subunit
MCSWIGNGLVEQSKVGGQHEPMSYALNCWYVAMWADDLRAEQIEARTICERPIVMFRRPDGTVAAMDDRCAHRFVPLSMGTLCDKGASIQCPYHGLQFDGSGTCVKNPHGTGRIPKSLQVRAYPVVERHTLLWIWLGDEPSDPATIPDFSYLDAGAPGVTSKRDWMTMSVNYQLMIDNLMDLSHASFLHRGVLGNDDTLVADLSVAQEGTTVTVTRLSPSVKPPELFDLTFKGDGATVDLWSVMRWDLPGCLRHDGGVCEPGTGRETGVQIIGSHLVTPTNNNECMYHFAAVRLGDHPTTDDAELSSHLSKLRRYAFEKQDAPILEAQQRAYDVVGGFDAAKAVALSVDAGPLRVRRVLAGQIALESETASGTL